MSLFIKPMIALDADGVIANFDKKVQEIFGMEADEYQRHHGPKAFWKIARNYRDDQGRGFYESLELMPDAMRLFDAVKHLDPVILTGCPIGDWAPEQKMRWGQVHFPNTKMITCLARDKSKYMKEGDILVDDRTNHRHLWLDAGGEFVHHISAEESIKELHSRFPILFQKTDFWSP